MKSIKLGSYSWGTLRVIETGGHTIVIHPEDWSEIKKQIERATMLAGRDDPRTAMVFKAECGQHWRVIASPHGWGWVTPGVDDVQLDFVIDNGIPGTHQDGRRVARLNPREVRQLTG